MFSKILFTALVALSFCSVAPLHADTAADCIANYQAAKTQFRSASLESDVECHRTGNTVSMFATGANPVSCGGEGEWHLEAKAVGGNDASCSIRILGNAGEGCETEKVTRPLQGREAADWRKFLEAECEEG